MLLGRIGRSRRGAEGDRETSSVQKRPQQPRQFSPSTRFGPGGPGLLPSQGSHRPGRARIRASGSLTNSFAIRMVPEAIRSTYVDMLKEPRWVQHVALDRFCWSTLRFPPLGPPGRVPQLRRYCQSVTTSYRHLAALRFLRLAIPRMHSLFSFSARRVHWQSLELVARYLQPGIAEEQKQDSPKFLGNLSYPFAMFQSDSGRTACVRPPKTQQRGPWYAKSRGSHERAFGAQ